jgi:hypothetical protein
MAARAVTRMVEENIFKEMMCFDGRGRFGCQVIVLASDSIGW